MYGIFWDCDGTIMDTERLYAYAWKTHLKEFGLTELEYQEGQTKIKVSKASKAIEQSKSSAIVSPNKAVLIIFYPNKETADRAFQAVKNNVAEVSKLLKMEINEGEVVFNQNSLTHQ